MPGRKKKGAGVASDAAAFIKKHRLVTKALEGASLISDKLGYGRKKRRKGRGLISTGLNIGSNLAGMFGFGRKKRRRGRGLISTGLNIGSNLAGMFGFGRKQMGGALTSENVKVLAF